MKIIHTGICGGETTDLIEEARKLEGYNLIVCSDRRKCNILWKQILDKKYDIPQPITFDEFVEGKFCGRNINAFLIDNAVILIRHMAKGVKIHAITFTDGDLND